MSGSDKRYSTYQSEFGHGSSEHFDDIGEAIEHARISSAGWTDNFCDVWGTAENKVVAICLDGIVFKPEGSE